MYGSVHANVKNTDVGNETEVPYSLPRILGQSAYRKRENCHDEMVVRQNFLLTEVWFFETNGHSPFIPWDMFKTVQEFYCIWLVVA